MSDTEAKFRTIFENVFDVIAYVDLEGRLLDVNERIDDFLGFKPRERAQLFK